MNNQMLNPFELIMNKLDNLEKLIIESQKNTYQTKEKNQETLMSRIEVAKYLKVSAVTINKWSNAGILKRYRIASRVYYKKSDIEKIFMT